MNKEDSFTRRVNFSILRYAGCWEDADILLRGLDPRPGSRILSICSGGDNSLALLSTNPSELTAVDISKVQLHMLALKKACFKKLSYGELLEFLGVHLSQNRWETYSKLKNELPKDAIIYWDTQKKAIEKGILYAGKFERYLGYFSRYFLPLIHGRKKVNELFRHKDSIRQQDFYRKDWNTWRWRLFFKLFFSRYIMGKLGRDPQFLKEVELSVHDFIYAKAGKHLGSVAAQENYFLHFMLRGSFDGALPFYLREENFEPIRSNIHKLHMEACGVDEVKDIARFDHLNLSNIFEYMPRDTFRKTTGKLVTALPPGARIAYWNLMVPRRISQEFPEKVFFEESMSKQLSEQDKGFFYDKFIIDVVR